MDINNFKEWKKIFEYHAFFGIPGEMISFLDWRIITPEMIIFMPKDEMGEFRSFFETEFFFGDIPLKGTLVLPGIRMSANLKNGSRKPFSKFILDNNLEEDFDYLSFNLFEGYEVIFSNEEYAKMPLNEPTKNLLRFKSMEE